MPVAYLLSPNESNNDATNYWIFSMKGLERIFDRAGWYITDIYSLGDTKKSTRQILTMTKGRLHF